VQQLFTTKKNSFFSSSFKVLTIMTLKSSRLMLGLNDEKKSFVENKMSGNSSQRRTLL